MIMVLIQMLVIFYGQALIWISIWGSGCHTGCVRFAPRGSAFGAHSYETMETRSQGLLRWRAPTKMVLEGR